MAETETKKKTRAKPKATKTELIGSQTQPAVLDSTTKLDIDTTKTLVDNIIGGGLTGRLDTSEIEKFTSISNARDQVYQLIDTMCKDSSVSSIVRTYAEDVCEVSDNGHIVWCESNDPKISKFVNYLLNVINVDKNVFSWTYCLLKYGDVYLRLYRESDYDDKLFSQASIDKAESGRRLNENVKLSTHATSDPYSFYVEMVSDPSTMFELTKYGKTYGYIEVPNAEQTQFDFSETFMGGTQTNIFNYKLKSNDVIVYQADDFVHACLEDNLSRFPETVKIFTSDTDFASDKNGLSYSVKRGKSLLYDSYKIWREKSLLEGAAILNRLTRSSIVRKVAVEVGDMSKEQAQMTLRRVKDMLEQKTAINTNTGMSEYNNPAAMENNIYYVTHNGQGAISIDSVGGDVNVKDLADLDWWNNKFYSSYGIPKQYFGWTDDGAGFNGGSALTVLSSVYAKGVKRVQNSIIQAITDIINLILINKGLKSYLNNFVLKMRVPVTQEEISYRESFTQKISALSNLNSLLTDVEGKTRRLEILKSLVGTLNFGDDIMAQIDKEIQAAKEAEAAEKAAAEKEAAEEAAEEAPATASANEESGAEDLDLSAMPMEGVQPEAGTVPLTEDGALSPEGEDDLPTAEELKKDFTENI